MRACNVKVEHLLNPIGIDIKNPTITWNCKEGKYQSAYELVATVDGVECFSTKKVESNSMSTQISYEAKSKERVCIKLRLWDENDEVGEWNCDAFYEMGLLNESDFVAKWINPELECDPNIHKPANYLKTTFSTDSTKNARLYITAHGLYEAFINEKRVGDFVLAPGTYDYDKHIAYQTYDVSALLKEGENDVEVILGDGWYRSVSGVDGDRNLYGEDVALYFQLEVDKKAICISDGNWVASQSGPIRENDMQQGEVVDLRISEIDEYHEVKVADFSKNNLICSNAVAIKEKEHFAGKQITTPNGQTVIDFGQNLAGYISVEIDAKEGETIVLTTGETLDKEGNFTQENFQDRKRHKEGGTNQRLTITCKEGLNSYKPKFTIWGFRYALVETDIDLTNAKFESIAAYSDMEELGEFECANDDINQLFSNSVWSMKSNFCDVPTDCPTRERAAWTGDMGVFIDTGLYMADCYSVVRKWLAECRLAQHEDGKVSNIAPRNNVPSFFSGLLAGSVGWGDAVIIVPYAMYLRYGDKKILEENYEMMKKWYAYLEKRAKEKSKNPVKFFKKLPNRDYLIETGIDYGEWCEPDVVSTDAMRTPQQKVATAYFAKSGQMLSEIAIILGFDSDAKHYGEVAKKATDAFRFVATEDGKIISDRQAEYIRAITFGLLSEDEKKNAASDLNELVIKCDYHLNTGFLSTPDLCRVLSEYGYNETAYRLLLQDTNPSWLYQVKCGATTIWENWDDSASLNHYSKGAISGWFFDGICGIKVKNNELLIKPNPNELLPFAKATYNSPLGKITSGYRYEENQIKYTFEIPANVTAKVELQDGRKLTLEPGIHTI